MPEIPNTTNDLRDAALRYAGWGWWVVPLHAIRGGCCTCRKGKDCGTQAGKHPRARWKGTVRPDATQIEKWWRRWPDANVGILTGARSGIGVVDVDGPAGAATLTRHLGAMPATRWALSGRPDGGRHGYYALTQPIPNSSGGGLDFRGDGGLVVAPPSRHWAGGQYAWGADEVPAPLPASAVAFFAARKPTRRTSQPAPGSTALPEGYRLARAGARLSDVALAVTAPPPQDRTAPLRDIEAALEIIPNPDMSWDDWKIVGMTIWASCCGAEEGAELFEQWSAKSKKYVPDRAFTAWDEITASPPTDLGFGSLVMAAHEVDPDWERPSRRPRAVEPPEMAVPHVNGHEPVLGGLPGVPEGWEPAKAGNPLIELNKRYAVIGDIGGKCLILSWVNSKVDDIIKVPSFQSFKSFSERYANQYVEIKKDDEVEAKQLGAYWLKWTKRKSYEGIDLVPNGPQVLPGGYLNLWSGFAVEPRLGRWELMRRHIWDVLAAGDPEVAAYIGQFAAWAVQNPGERAEVALVFRGGKGSGKGTFANALRRIFGQHGLQIFNSKHLVGAFNGHLRNCLLLFADEAFWAGDKQGESVLKGMVTEPALMIEQKGIDAAPWKNRLHVIMSANAAWVVPATHDERRYVMVDVAPDRIGDEAYFRELHAEMRDGGLGAMLHDLQRVDLRGWHPRRIIKTAALTHQKELSLDPRSEWWEGLLQSGLLPFGVVQHAEIPGSVRVAAGSLLRNIQDTSQKLRDTSAQALGRFLGEHRCKAYKKAEGNWWIIPDIVTARTQWENRYGGWNWQHPCDEWRVAGSKGSKVLPEPP